MTQLYRNVYATPGHPKASGTRGKDRLGVIGEHTLVAEAVLGRYFPEGAEVHHVDGNGLNNEHRNLVVCQDRAYHHLLHQRLRALRACGHAGWRKCRFCKQWDAPEKLYINGKNANHRGCFNKYERDRRYQSGSALQRAEADSRTEGKRKCWVCKQYDDPNNLYVRGTSAYHRGCFNQHRREKRAQKRIR